MVMGVVVIYNGMLQLNWGRPENPVTIRGTGGRVYLNVRGLGPGLLLVQGASHTVRMEDWQYLWATLPPQGGMRPCGGSSSCGGPA